MELFPIEIRPPFQPPSEDAKLVLLADGGIHFDGADLRRHLSRCVRYAREHRVHLVSGLFVHEGNLCLCLLGPDGQALCRQPALHLSLPLRGALRPGERAEVVHTELGNLFLCVDADIYHPQVLRTAALKGADAVLSVQCLDPAEETPERVLCTVWNAAQSNNVYVANFAAGGAVVCCPAPVTRAGDGYLVRRTDALPVRFALNMERLDEIRARFELMEQINPALVENYAAELGS